MALPVIDTQPLSVTVQLGALTGFSIVADDPGGAGAYTYWWFMGRNGIGTPGGNDDGEHTPDLAITANQYTANQSFYCKVTNPATGETTVSASANLYVTYDSSGGSGPGSGGGIGAPVYSGGASAFAAYFAESFGTEGVYPDGDWSTAQPDGMAWPEFPFETDGDQATVVTKRRWMQMARYWLPTALGTLSPYNVNLVLIDEDEFKLMPGGIVSWIRTYATLPSKRSVYESFSYGFQFLTSSGSGVRLAETAFMVTSRVFHEFYHVNDRSSYPPLLAPRYLQLADRAFFKRGTGNLYQDSTYPALIVSPDAEILAEDSTERLWKYPYMERRSRYIAGPTLAFWGSSLNITVPPASS